MREMTVSPIQREARDLLLSYIHPDYAENSEEARQQVELLTTRASDLAAGVLPEIMHIALRLGVLDKAIRTRQTKFTQLGWTIGLSIYNRPIVTKGGSTEVVHCALPSRGSTSEVGFYVSGVRNDASGLTSPIANEMRCGTPVRRAIINVTNENREIIMHEVELWIRDGLAQCS